MSNWLRDEDGEWQHWVKCWASAIVFAAIWWAVYRLCGELHDRIYWSGRSDQWEMDHRR